MVFCAASLMNVVTEIADSFQVKYNKTVQLNFASSGTLVRQIDNGAFPGIYISANKKWVDYLNKKGKTISKFEKTLAGNSMVVVVPKKSQIRPFAFDSARHFFETLNGRLSIGNPKHVPAGEYAMQAINNSGYIIQHKDFLLLAKDVRSALLMVELGEVDAGITYKTDAKESLKVKIVSEIPPSLHDPVSYEVSVLQNYNENTLCFYHFLSSETAKSILIKNDFYVK